MRAAGLHAIDTLLSSSEAVLISASSPKPLSIRTPEEQKKVEGLIELVKNRIAGVVASSKYVLCQYNVQRERLAEALVRFTFSRPKEYIILIRLYRESLQAVVRRRSALWRDKTGLPSVQWSRRRLSPKQWTTSSLLVLRTSSFSN
jgi:ATP phosphoribosyltransferase